MENENMRPFVKHLLGIFKTITIEHSNTQGLLSEGPLITANVIRS